jgi:hypothetical protein
MLWLCRYKAQSDQTLEAKVAKSIHGEGIGNIYEQCPVHKVCESLAGIQAIGKPHSSSGGREGQLSRGQGLGSSVEGRQKVLSHAKPARVNERINGHFIVGANGDRPSLYSP